MRFSLKRQLKPEYLFDTYHILLKNQWNLAAWVLMTLVPQTEGEPNYPVWFEFIMQGRATERESID